MSSRISKELVNNKIDFVLSLNFQLTKQCQIVHKEIINYI